MQHNGGSRPGHKVSGTWSKFPNLNKNGQNCVIFREVFLNQNLVKILSRSATARIVRGKLTDNTV